MIILNRRKFINLGSSAMLASLKSNSFAAEINKQTHFQARANKIIVINMPGAVSHIDTFDYKPMLFKNAGQRGRFGRKLMPPIKEFKRFGNSGLPISTLFPEIGKHADELCLLHGHSTDQPNHPQAQIKIHTGNVQFSRPSLGSWIMYGLGSENNSLPGFVVLNPRSGSSPHFGSAFLPSRYQGTAVGEASRGNRVSNSQTTFPNIKNKSFSNKLQKRQLDFISSLNKTKLTKDVYNPSVDAVQDSFEMAFRMQNTMPETLDLNKESKKTLSLYGIDNDVTQKLGQKCLLARRFAEAGCRYIELGHEGWDHHSNLKNDLSTRCAEIDKPIAGLITDLKQRGLFKDTLIVWCSEFGRTPESPNMDGRDHNPKGFTTWMAGAGVKGGIRYGATDELGYEAVSGRLSIHDWHATILHIMGLDHERLTYRYAGRDFRPTDVYGDVAKDILT
jgi:hypothetical protein